MEINGLTCHLPTLGDIQAPMPYVLLTKKEYISFNNYNIQQFNFHGSVVSSVPLSLNTLENKIINLCVHLQNGRAFFDDVEQIIKIYEETDHALLNDVSLLLLKSCGKFLPNVDVKTRQKLTKRVWNLIQNKDCQLTLEHYNALLAAYAQNSEVINPVEFLDNMRLQPDESVYCSLLNAISNIEDHASVSNIISKMKKDIRSWSKETFDAVIEIRAMQCNMKEANKVITQMQSLGIMPSPETYLCLAYGFAKMGDLKNIVQIFEKNQPSVENVMKVIRIVSLYGYGKHISSILKFLPMPLKEDELTMINNTIIDLTYSGQRSEALKIITDLPKDIEIIDACIEYVKCFVDKEIQLNTSDQDILQVVRELMGSKYSSQIINKATKVALHHGKEALTLLFFEDMKKNGIPIRSHYYWPLLVQAHNCLDQKKLHSLISHMISLNVEIDNDTFIDYIFPFLDVTDPVATTKTLINTGIDYPIAIVNMAAFLLHNDRLKDVISLCSAFKIKLDFRESCLRSSLLERYKSNKSNLTFVSLMLQIPYKQHPPFVYILDALLNEASHSEELEEFIEFLEILKKHDVKISKADIEVIKQRVNKMNTTKNESIQTLLNDMSNEDINANLESNLTTLTPESVLSPYPHPKKMDFNELQNHIVELKHKKMGVRGSTKKLLFEYCMKLNLEAAEAIKQDIISNNFEWTAGMSAALFSLYVKKNMLDKAEIELNEIQKHHSYFLIDNYKLLSYVRCLVENNRLEDAFNAINNIKNINWKVNVNNKCFQLLTVIAESKFHDKTEKMLETLVKNNYCKIENILLIPLVQRHVLNNDIKSATDAFVHCVQKYKETPLKQKLTNMLISAIDSSVPGATEMLKTVMKCISNIHGEEVAVVHLITALVETEQVSKLQKVFQTQHVEMKLLTHHLQALYSSTDKVNRLFTLFEAIKNMEKISKRPLCDLILSIYEKNNNYEGATAFLRKMEESNIIPSEYFKRIFCNLVATNKQVMQH
ncbi:hypothetical protein KPH14_008732 [Odynerus spinipes]|uniref:Leucine-rich PPR motif-containing protein, mitochondrial n=1 Tax=Odynerus spinipes TaxID=1348599 RepID=A0AAD9VHR2_9HYME|nr:hypothetical protein KPH14_008732 [Odynerus spinipes]